MGFPGTGKIWMNGSLVDWADAKIHIASHVVHYGSGVFEGARCYDTPKGSACFRLDAHMRRLYDSAKIYRMEYPLDLAGWRDAVLETIRANEFKACYIRPIVYRGYETLGVNPVPLPGRRRHPGLGMGRLPRRRRAGAGRGREGQLVVARGAQHVPDARQERRELRELAADQDGSDRRRLQRRDRARHQRPHQRGQRPEPVPGPRRRALHAAALGVDPRRHHARLDHADRARPRLHGQRDRCRASALHRRRGVLRRHGRRGHADPVGRQDHRRRRPARPGHRGHPEGVLRRRQRRDARHARLADVRLPGGGRPARSRPDGGKTAVRV